MQQDYSYGIVPVFKNEQGTYEFLLIEQISYRGGTHRFWTFPKGHAEVGETPEAAALRELEEETGITEVSIAEQGVFTVNYTFSHQGTVINKHVTYYLGYCTNKDTLLSQPHEIQEMRWCSFADAMQLLSHDTAKDVLRRAQSLLT